MERNFPVIPIFRNFRPTSRRTPKISEWNSGKCMFHSLPHPEFPDFGRMESALYLLQILHSPWAYVIRGSGFDFTQNVDQCLPIARWSGHLMTYCYIRRFTLERRQQKVAENLGNYISVYRSIYFFSFKSLSKNTFFPTSV